ncbi:MAG: protoporphyrinogen oxidase HemJ [Arenicella sp.]
MMYIWIKAFHLIAIICWFAALFYLPRLFVYHSMAEDQVSKDRFKVMERKLYRGIMTPSMAATIILGFYLATRIGFNGGWLHIKLVLVAALVGYHIYCGKLMRQFAADQNTHGHVFYRWFNELPVVLLIAIVILAVVKPF